MPGLDRAILDTVDFDQVISRIKLDVRTDFILAPHFNIIFSNAQEELCDLVRQKLKSGTYQPGQPCTVSVPKGRGFVRPGSILQPLDRVVYQLLIDASSPHLEEQLDRTRTFSHVVADSDDIMFEPDHTCWSAYQQSLMLICVDSPHIVKADIANYFERIPQHHLINLMSSAGCPQPVVSFMEEILLAFQARDSFGIVQGIFASDMLGNFFLSEFDAYCEIHDINSARFVDDIYMGFKSRTDAETGLVKLIEHLRQNGLHLNEFKSGIREANEIIREETEIDDLFELAREEAKEELNEYFESAYGYTGDWDDSYEPDDDEVELSATHRLYNSINQYPDQADKISRFCLPLLRATFSDFAVDSVLQDLVSKPHLTQLHLSYLSGFTARRSDIVEFLGQLIISGALQLDFQRMYIFGALMNAQKNSRPVCNAALKWLENKSIAKEARAMAALFVAKFGTPNQKRAVRLAYENEPAMYVKTAILYASKYFTTPERRTCLRAWGGHSETNILLGHAMRATT